MGGKEKRKWKERKVYQTDVLSYGRNIVGKYIKVRGTHGHRGIKGSGEG